MILQQAYSMRFLDRQNIHGIQSIYQTLLFAERLAYTGKKEINSEDKEKDRVWKFNSTPCFSVCTMNI